MIGQRLERNRDTFYRLGDLLGQLHCLPVPPDITTSGGTWHYLSLVGGISEECRAAVRMSNESSAAGSNNDQARCEKPPVTPLQDELGRLAESLTKQPLPTAIVHPDFVLANTIVHTDSQANQDGGPSQYMPRKGHDVLLAGAAFAAPYNTLFFKNANPSDGEFTSHVNY
jgi:hypothetical protein